VARPITWTEGRAKPARVTSQRGCSDGRRLRGSQAFHIAPARTDAQRCHPLFDAMGQEDFCSSTKTLRGQWVSFSGNSDRVGEERSARHSRSAKIRHRPSPLISTNNDKHLFPRRVYAPTGQSSPTGKEKPLMDSRCRSG